MRVPAKALPCLLFCVASVILLPTAVSAHTRPASPHVAKPVAATPSHGGQRHRLARHHTKAPHAAPKLALSSPHDTSNRFLMTQNGHQMTADDFEAWMKARGIRVAKGAPVVAKGAD
jgi:hypothetical protein